MKEKMIIKPYEQLIDDLFEFSRSEHEIAGCKRSEEEKNNEENYDYCKRCEKLLLLCNEDDHIRRLNYASIPQSKLDWLLAVEKAIDGNADILKKAIEIFIKENENRWHISIYD